MAAVGDWPGAARRIDRVRGAAGDVHAHHRATRGQRGHDDHRAGDCAHTRRDPNANGHGYAAHDANGHAERGANGHAEPSANRRECGDRTS